MTTPELTTLSPPEHPRRGWGMGCWLCHEPFAESEVIRHVLLPDGSRPFVHERHLAGREPDCCPHGTSPASDCQRCAQLHEHPPEVRLTSRTFRARRKGVCIVCRKPFTRGQLIAKGTTKAYGAGWTHAEHAR